MSEWKTSACILCECNCGIEVQLGGEGGREIVRIRGDKAHPASAGYLCQKASGLNYYQNGKDRLTSPLRRRPDGRSADRQSLSARSAPSRTSSSPASVTRGSNRRNTDPSELAVSSTPGNRSATTAARKASAARFAAGSRRSENRTSSPERPIAITSGRAALAVLVSGEFILPRDPWRRPQLTRTRPGGQGPAERHPDVKRCNILLAGY